VQIDRHHKNLLFVSGEGKRKRKHLHDRNLPIQLKVPDKEQKE